MACLQYRKCMLIMILCLLFCLLPINRTASGAENKDLKHIILISVGGLNYESYISVPVPNMKYLSSDGVVCEKTLAIKTDTLESAEASLLTGTLPGEHRHGTVKDPVEVESIFELMKKDGRSILLIDGSGGKLQGFSHGDKEYVKMGKNSTSRTILDTAFKRFSADHPFMTYIYIDDCSRALLTLDQKAYYDAIKDFDAHLGSLIKNLRDAGVYEDSVIIVTSARSSSPSNMVPLVISGPGFKSNSSTTGALVIDVFSTICNISGFERPITARGLPLYGSIRVSEDEQASLMQLWIRELLKDRTNNWTMNYQVQDDLQRTIHQMNAIKEEKQSIFDFAGEREQLIVGLKTKLTVERTIWIIAVLLMLFGYFIEYIWLKRKYLLFK